MSLKKIIENILPHGLYEFMKKHLSINFLNVLRTNFKYFHIRENSILLIELLYYHGEILPGLAKYSLDLGYNVDIVMKNRGKRGEGRNDVGLFSCFSSNSKIRIYNLSNFNMNFLLRSSSAGKYEHIILASFYDQMAEKQLYKVDLFKLKPVCVMHNHDIVNSYFKTEKIISMVKMDCINRKPPYVVNSHYFGEFPKKEKSKMATFVTLNAKDLYRRNLFLLFEACDMLYEKRAYMIFLLKLLEMVLKFQKNTLPIFISLVFLIFSKCIMKYQNLISF